MTVSIFLVAKLSFAGEQRMPGKYIPQCAFWIISRCEKKILCITTSRLKETPTPVFLCLCKKKNIGFYGPPMGFCRDRDRP